MPTIARVGPYRVFFFSNEDLEPPHVHIERDESLAKFWLDPVDLVTRGSFPTHELNKLLKLVVEHQHEWLEKWREYHRNTQG
jgi:Domain of unknown function (DUF4160)